MPTKLELKRKKKRAYYNGSKKQKGLQLSEQNSFSDTLEGPVTNKSKGNEKNALNETAEANAVSCIPQTTVKPKNRFQKITEKSTSHRKTYYKNYYMFNKEKLKHASQTNFAKKRKRINYTNDPFSVQKCMQVNNSII